MNSANYSHIRPARRSYCRSGDGQVMAVILLSILPLISLVILVMCVGDQVNRKVKLQNAADLSAEAAATQAARSMNLIAANNIHIERMLAAIVTLDDLERCMQNASEQSEAFGQRIARQLKVKLPSDFLRDVTEFAISSLNSEIASEQEQLGQYLPDLRELDLQRYTTWNTGESGEDPDGAFWRALMQMTHINEITVLKWPQLIQSAAITSVPDESISTCVLPFSPEPVAEQRPWEHWYSSLNSDYRDSILEYGWIPDLDFGPHIFSYEDDEIDELFVRSGAFWSLFRWRYPVARMPSGEDRGNFTGSTSSMSPRPGTVTTPGAAIAWRSYGPIELARSRILDFWLDDIRLSTPMYTDDRSISYIIDGLQDAKLLYIFGDDDDDDDDDDAGGNQLISLHWPDWEIDFDTARHRAEIDDEPVELTTFFSLYITGAGDPEAIVSGLDFNDSQHTNAAQMAMTVYSGWDVHDSDINSNNNSSSTQHFLVQAEITPPSPGSIPEEYKDIELPETILIPRNITLYRSWEVVADYIWEAIFHADDFQAALEAVVDRWDSSRVRNQLNLPDDYPEIEVEYILPSEYHSWITREIFAGADFGGDVAVHNPANWSDAEQGDLPGPFLLDMEMEDYSDSHDLGIRRQRLSFTSVAWSSASPAVWRDRFGSANPYGVNLTLARAAVYNPTSFDLWTQDWASQLIAIGAAVEDLGDIEIDEDFLADIQSEIPGTQYLNIENLESVMEMVKKLCGDSQAMREVMKH